MIVNVPAIDYRGTVDLDDGIFDFPLRGAQVPRNVRLLGDSEVMLRGAEIAPRTQIQGVVPAGGSPNRTVTPIRAQIHSGPPHRVHGHIDVAEGGVPPTPCRWIIFFPVDVFPGAPEQLHDPAKASGTIQVRVHPRMIVKIPAVEHRGTVDLNDRSFDFTLRGA
jgi:hypothetical protein